MTDIMFPKQGKKPKANKQLKRTPIKQKLPTKKPCASPLCDKEFLPTVSGKQKTCYNFKCAMDYVDHVEKLKAEKKQRRINATSKKEFYLKDRSTQEKLAQQAFNAFIRMRDDNEPCISCQRHHSGQYHAGHYLSRGAHPALRFDEDNCHKQCAPCNNHLSGNIASYRINLINKIGVDAVESLEGPHKAMHLSVDEIVKIKEAYKLKLKELKAAA